MYNKSKDRFTEFSQDDINEVLSERSGLRRSSIYRKNKGSGEAPKTPQQQQQQDLQNQFLTQTQQQKAISNVKNQAAPGRDRSPGLQRRNQISTSTPNGLNSPKPPKMSSSSSNGNLSALSASSPSLSSKTAPEDTEVAEVEVAPELLETIVLLSEASEMYACLRDFREKVITGLGDRATKYNSLAHEGKKWFYGPCNRVECEAALKGTPEGSFLVRIGKKTNNRVNFVLSVVNHQSQVRHLMITEKHGRFCFSNQASHQRFDNICQMIAWFKIKCLTVRTKNGYDLKTVLKKGMVRSAYPVSPDNSHHAQKLRQQLVSINESLNPTMIMQQYSSIPSFQLSTSVSQAHPEKNRYRDVLQYNWSRVKLDKLQENDDDYFNASLINISYPKGPDSSYIASQGPTENCLEDFWRMIWSYNVPIIVMLTQLIEGVTEKCTAYWPEQLGETLHFGALTVRNIGGEEDSCHVSTLLELSYMHVNRVVVHMRYTQWLDQKVPTGDVGFLDFMYQTKAIHKICESKAPHLGPTLYHCSAGVGRTGTMIAIDACSTMLSLDAEDISVFDLVCTLRAHRPEMVQNCDQYNMIYECLRTMALQGLIDLW